MTDVRISEVENIIMAGNQIEKLSGDIMTRMRYAKKVDLRMNLLTLPPSETVKFVALEHLTHLDIRDNKVRLLQLKGKIKEICEITDVFELYFCRSFQICLCEVHITSILHINCLILNSLNSYFYLPGC